MMLQGSTVGMTHLGFLYLRGIAVTQDVAQAFRYFKSAADAVRSGFYIYIDLSPVFL